MTMPLFKQVESNYGKKSPVNEVVIGLLSFLNEQRKKYVK